MSSRNVIDAVLAVLLGAVLFLAVWGFREHPAITGIVLAVLPLVGLAGYYIFLKMVRLNVFWTEVESGWCRIVLGWRKYQRTIGPGLRWIGIPGMHTLYKRKMAFLKGVIKDDGTVTVEVHNDENITSFKTTRYPYAIPFKDEEDCQGLPLSGAVVANGRMVDARKMFFDEASDWYATIVFLVLSCLREIITMISYEDITGQHDPSNPKAVKAAKKKVRTTIAQLLWEKMTAPREGGKLSVVAELLQTYGIEVDSVELASIDPPPEWRAITLAPYKARKEKEAAKEQAKASAALFDDTNQALQAWLKGQRDAGHDPTLEEIKAKQEELRDRALAKTPGYQQVHIKGLEGATTAVVGSGGGAGIIIGGGGKGGTRDSQSPSNASGSNPIGFGAGAGNQPSAKKGGKRKRVVDMTEEEKERFAREQDGA